VEEKELLAAGAPIEEEKVLLGSEILDEVEKMVLSSVVLPGSWCSLDLFFWVEPDWAGGHRHPMFESSWSLPMHKFAVTKYKISQVRHKKRNWWNFDKVWCKTELPMTIPSQPMCPKK